MSTPRAGKGTMRYPKNGKTSHIRNLSANQNPLKRKSSHRVKMKRKRTQNNLPRINEDKKMTKYKRREHKICIGDRVKVTTSDGGLKGKKGVVLYIGYPYPGRGIRYGINLKTAKGHNDGSLRIDKSGKVRKSMTFKNFGKKQTKKRQFFKAKKNHGIFVKKEDINEVEYESSTNDRLTIEDRVKHHFRGKATIKFIGILQHYQDDSVWYGIELDDRKGQHDGTLKGFQYFQCAAQYGMFCRQNQLTLIEDEKDSPLNAQKSHKKGRASDLHHGQPSNKAMS